MREAKGIVKIMKIEKKMHGKRYVLMILVVVVVAIGIYILISQLYNGLKNKGVGFQKDYFLAAFDTTEHQNDSVLVYYNQEFNEVFRQKIAIGDMCDAFSPPIAFEDKIYAAPKGLGNEYDADEVVEIDKKTGKIQSYQTNQKGVMGMAVSEKYIFTVCNWNMVGTLARIDKETKKVSELTFPREGSFQIDIYGNYLYCFLQVWGTTDISHTRCCIVDIDTMEEVKSFDITEYGKTPDYTYLKNDVLYMPINHTNKDEPCGLLLMYDTKTEELKQVDLKVKYACQVLEYGNHLLITHANITGGNTEENSVTIYDPESGEFQNYAVSSVLYQVVMKNHLLYALDLQEQMICVYDFNGSGEQLELVNKYTLKSKEGTSVYRYFIGGFFMN